MISIVSMMGQVIKLFAKFQHALKTKKVVIPPFSLRFEFDLIHSRDAIQHEEEDHEFNSFKISGYESAEYIQVYIFHNVNSFNRGCGKENGTNSFCSCQQERFCGFPKTVR